MRFTAPDDAEVGQQTALVTLDDPFHRIEAVRRSELVVDYPPGTGLRLASPALEVEEAEQRLTIVLPAEEQEFDLTLVSAPSETAIKITVTTKKEGSKPDGPRRALFPG